MTQRLPRAQPSLGESSWNLESWSTLCNLQTAQKVEGYPFLVVQLVWASSGQLGSFVLLVDSSEALWFFQSACLTIVLFYWASSKQFGCLPAIFTAHVLLRRESTSRSDKFQGLPEVSLVYFLPSLSFPTGWDVLFPPKTFCWCFRCKHLVS